MGPIEYDAPPLRPMMSPLQEGTHGPGIPPQVQVQVLPEVLSVLTELSAAQSWSVAPSISAVVALTESTHPLCQIPAVSECMRREAVGSRIGAQIN